MADSGGNGGGMTKLGIHCAAADTDSAAPRILLGNISPSSTHTTGPHVAPNETTNRLAPTRATPLQGLPSCGVLVPSSATVMTAWVNASVIAPSATNMPAEPASSSTRRPILSTSAMATTVTAMLVTAVTTEMTNESDSLKPTACHSVVE